jgi:hypothetical protein
MTCEELLKALNEYVDDEAALAVCREFAFGWRPSARVANNAQSRHRPDSR